LPGYEASGITGFGAPKGTPADIIETLNKEVNAGLYPQKWTNSRHVCMSALCQKRTRALQQKCPLFDHLVGTRV
jgi:hypothetical protein